MVCDAFATFDNPRFKPVYKLQVCFHTAIVTADVTLVRGDEKLKADKSTEDKWGIARSYSVKSKLEQTNH